VLADLRLPGVLGTEIIVHADPVPVVIMTSHASVRSAVDAMRAGAIDYVAKPFDHDELLLVIERSLSQNRLQAQNNALLMDMRRLLPAPAILSCTEIGQVHEKIQTQFHQQRFLFIAGERGVGREWLARLLHWHGEAAHGGTLVIRQPALLPHALQSTLAEVLTRRGLAKQRASRVYNIQVILVSDVPIQELQQSGQLLTELADLFNAIATIYPLVHPMPALWQRYKRTVGTVTHKNSIAQLNALCWRQTVALLQHRTWGLGLSLLLKTQAPIEIYHSMSTFVTSFCVRSALEIATLLMVDI